MQVYHLPFDLLRSGEAADEVIIRTYRSDQTTNKNRIVLQRNMINLMVAGKKMLYRTDGNVTIYAGEMVMLCTGNVLTSEIKPEDAHFKSILIYYSNELLQDFLLKHKPAVGATTTGHDGRSFVHLKQDAFISHYAQSLDLLSSAAAPLSPELKLLKLEELLTYLYDRFPAALQALAQISQYDEDVLIRKVVENNITAQITVEELAFLCNCSLSSFKRKFSRLYHTSPQKWLVEQKLALAALLLGSPHESPGSVYMKVGYENHSSFSQAFKARFGVSPKDYVAVD